MSFIQCPPLWELIACTRFHICNNELREQAYNNIKELFYSFFSRKTLPLLEQARLAACLRSDLGHTFPYLIQSDPTTLTVRYFISLSDANNPKYLERLSAYVKDPGNARNINFQDLNIINEKDDFALPDFSRFNFNVRIHDVVLKSNFNVGGFAHLS